MLERWIVKHWIALSAGCLLMAAAVRMAYAAIGGEWAIIPIVFLIEWFIKARRREARRKCRNTRA